MTRTSPAHLRAVRQAQNRSLRTTARAAGIDPAQLSRFERGSSGLSIDSLARLAGVLGLRELEQQVAPFARRGR